MMAKVVNLIFTSSRLGIIKYSLILARFFTNENIALERNGRTKYAYQQT